MSIQAGQWNCDGKPIDDDFLSRVSRLAAPYAPHGGRVHVDGCLTMLYRPYHSTHESYSERQPTVSPGGNVLTWDGRLDNRHDLVDQLAVGVTYKSTDAEIVTAAFECWGTNCFRQFVGDWALTVWRAKTRELILARDYVGIRQLFYHHQRRSITWCTCLAALCLSGQTFHLCDEYVAGYLGMFPDAHLTPYEELRSVPPASFVRFTDGKMDEQRYWEFKPTGGAPSQSDSDYEENYRYLLTQSVRRRLRTSSPVLAELSGGLDSSAIVCVADDLLSRGSVAATRLDTFSYYDSTDPDEDDFAFFTKVEETRGRSGTHIDLKGTADSLPLQNLNFLATPGFEIRSEVQEALSRIASTDEYRVLLCGIGGDEVNGQAVDACLVLADHALHLHLSKFAKELVTLSLLTRRPVLHLLFDSLRQLFPGFIRQVLHPGCRLDPWINPHFARRSGLGKRQVNEIKGKLFGLRLRDSQQTIGVMARRATYIRPFPIERRYPYLDQSLVEFLLGVPFDQLFRSGTRRSLMRRALVGMVPREILERATKASVSRCYSLSLQKHWGTVAAAFKSSLSAQLGYVDPAEVRKALEAMRIGNMPPYFIRLLKVVSLELWLRDAEAHGVLSLRSDPSAVKPTSSDSLASRISRDAEQVVLAASDSKKGRR
jgi:asparagine synthase (glutamine-hydrolysing)